MKLLLDTHTFLWVIVGSPNLSAAAQIALTDPANHAVYDALVAAADF